jgi:Spy/CpxP family protein refolding chaperone
MGLTNQKSISKEILIMLTNRGRMSKIVVMLCIAALTAYAGIAQADIGGCGEGQHQHHNFKKFAKKLALTDAQKAQAKTIFQANKDLVQPVVANLRTEQKNLRALIHADTIDEAAIRAETAKVAGIQADLNVNRAKGGAQFRAILTPAQQAILKTLHQKSCNKKPGVAAAPAE